MEKVFSCIRTCSRPNKVSGLLERILENATPIGQIAFQNSLYLGRLDTQAALIQRKGEQPRHFDQAIYRIPEFVAILRVSTCSYPFWVKMVVIR